MEYFRFTLFNALTLLVMGLTLAVAVQRFTARHTSNWPLAYYAAVLGYTFAFDGGLHPAWVLAGLACALLIRSGYFWKHARALEAVVFGYILWRCLGLILLW